MLSTRSMNGQGDAMGASVRGRARGRGFRGRRLVPYSCRARRPRGVRISSYHSPGDVDEASSDDSTQPPSHPWEPPCATTPLEPEPRGVTSPSPLPELHRDQIIVDAHTEPNRVTGHTMPPECPVDRVGVDAPTEPNIVISFHIELEPTGVQIGEDTPTGTVQNQAQKRRGRGPAKCTEFEKWRKHGKVLLKINTGKTAPCCSNANMFTTRVTWIVKHHCDMSYARWSDVPQAHKDELIDRVRGDFELDWELENHRLTVTKQLRKRFNAFHHELHSIYLSYGSHEEALASGTERVSPLVWVKLCTRWGSEAFKKISNKNRENRKKLLINHTAGRKSFVRILEEKRAESANLVDFFKETHWSKKNSKFITAATEDKYKDMVGKLDTLEPEQRTSEAAAGVFKEVLGSRPGYARGLGEMVIPESTRQRSLEREREYIALIEKHKKEAESSKSEMEAMKANMQKLLERQEQTDRLLRAFFVANPSLSESVRETESVPETQ
ncbi:uncharacterized protein LOC122297717 [Carya illinoinensis]|uniref:uncharacterized protein LOC122297717 n=1 Tax=Carya illinoinensis TaxID=32201 RepID=UPI001C72528F|nr:uncharacterized protein LOC122297717 [Carya illinoinensis]